MKDKCLEIYRNQKPDIHPYPEAMEILENLIKRSIKVGIITDGRVEGQKNKIKALKLDKIVKDIVITDELGGIQFRKPNDIAFRIMQCRWRLPFEQIAYVGDNITKDFQAPKQLGMQGLYFDNKESLYYKCEQSSKTEFMLDNLKDIYNLSLIHI